MSNCICDELTVLKKFKGYQHYEYTLEDLEKNTENGRLRKLEENDYEITYQCTSCRQLWKLGIPDFPIVGYLHRERK